jgi:hypothetical protein
MSCAFVTFLCLEHKYRASVCGSAFLVDVWNKWNCSFIYRHGEDSHTRIKHIKKLKFCDLN